MTTDGFAGSHENRKTKTKNPTGNELQRSLATIQKMRPTVSLGRWKFHTVEWSPKVAEIQSQLNATHFVLPDLPNVYTPQDRSDYFSQVPPSQRILTVATSRYTSKTLIDSTFQADTLLLVGGNEKTSSTLSTVEAAEILSNDQHSSNTILWATTNPNDPHSIERVQQKIDAGITGFLTQPLLSSHALEVLEAYPRRRPSEEEDSRISYVAGLAMPQTAKSLQFWCKLLEQPQLEKDPLFQAHLAFFSQPYFTSMAWIGRELEHLKTHATIDGIHFMPLGNTQDLLTVFRNINLPTQ